MSDRKTALVISAHSADFVWRAGGAIALHAAKGYDVTVVCLSYGERGESAKLWKQEGMTLEKVKTARRQEAENAAKALGISDIRFLDRGDYPLDLGRETLDMMVDIIREVQPKFMFAHSKWDPYNTDHMRTTEFALEARMVAQAWGHNPGEKVLGAPQLYLFEPHQTEQMGWKPNVFLDITEVWDRKRAAIQCMQGQEHLWQFYDERGRKPRQPLPPQFRRAGRRQARQIRRGFRGGVPAHCRGARMSDVAHLGHVEVYTDRFDESLDFFTRVYGLKLSELVDDSAYLRAWDDYEFHSLKLTRHDTTGVGHIGYRVASPRGAGAPGGGDRGVRLHGAGLGRGRRGPWPGLPVRRPVRPCLRALLGDPAVRGAGATSARRSRIWPAGSPAPRRAGSITSTCWPKTSPSFAVSWRFASGRG